MKTVRFFWNYFKVYKLSFVIVILMVAVATIAQALFPVFSGQAVTELANLVLAYQNGTSELAWQSLSALMLNLALVVLVLVVSSLIYMTLMTRVIAESTNEMRKGLFGKLSRLTVSFFDRHQDGDILSRFTSDLDNILQAFNESLVQVMSNIALYIGLIFVMFSKNVTLALITVASTPVAFLMLVFIVKMARKYTNLQQKEVGKLNAYMDESISGQKAIIVQGIQDDIVAGFVERNERVRKATFKGRMFSGILFPVMNGMSLVNTAIVIFAGSAVLLNDPSIETTTALGLIVEGQLAHFTDFYFQLPSLLRLKFVDMMSHLLRRQSFALCDVVLHLLKEVVIDRNCHLLYVFQTDTLRTVQLQFQSLGLFIRCCFIDYKLPSIGCPHPQRIAHGSLPCSSPASQIYSSIGVQSS